MSTEQQLIEQLKNLSDSSTVIIAIGNVLKGDDGAGPLICEQLAKKKISAKLIDAGTVPENYIQKIIEMTPANLLVIDAIDFGATPGTIQIFEPEQINSLVISTHTLSPRLFVDMIRQNITLDVHFIGIQPAQIELGQSISEQVRRAIQQICNILIEVFPPQQQQQ
jgi:hydrogenase 3 maturation protease